MATLEEFCAIKATMQPRLLGNMPAGTRIDFAFEGTATSDHWEGERPVRGVDYVTALARASDDWLWVGTRVAGLRRCRIQPWSCELIPEQARGRDGMGRQHVTALRYDPAGALWVATDGSGLFRVSGGDGPAGVRFERWGEEHGLLSEAIMSI